MRTKVFIRYSLAVAALLTAFSCGRQPENAASILERTGCTEIHASASETINGKKVTSPEKVSALIDTLQ